MPGSRNDTAEVVRLLKSMRVLRLLPGDVLVLTRDGPISDEMASILLGRVNSYFKKLGVTGMVLGDGLKVGAIRPVDSSRDAARWREYCRMNKPGFIEQLTIKIDAALKARK